MSKHTAFVVREIATNRGLALSHKSAGGESIRQFIAEVHDGWLRIMLAVEPLIPTVTAMHISISHRRLRMGPPGPRRPTDEECAEVRHQLRKFESWYGEFMEENNKGSKVRNFWNQRFR